MLKGLVAWDTWAKNPSEAAGAALVNVGTFFIPGAGEVGGVIKALTIGTKLEIVASALTKVEEVTSKVTAVIPDALGDLLTKLRTDKVDVNVDSVHVEIPTDIHATIGAHPDTPTLHTSSGGDHAPDPPSGTIHDSGSTVVHDTRPSETGSVPHHEDPGTGPAPDHHDHGPQHPDDGTASSPDAPTADHPAPSVPPHDPPTAVGDGLDPAEAARRDPNTGNQPDGSWEGKGGLRLDPTDNSVVQQYAADAVTAEQHIRPDIQNLVESTPDAHLVGLDDSVKFADSLKDKVAKLLSDPDKSVSMALSDVKDSVRYTAEIAIDPYSANVTRTVEGMKADGYSLVKWSNTWEDAGYKGINSSWIDPVTGKTFELQFHTPESYLVKTGESHDLYKQMGVPGISRETLAALKAENDQRFANLVVPPGATDLTFELGL